MAVSISNAFVQEYKDSVIHLAQQGDARVRPHVREVSSNAEYYNWDRLAEVDTSGYSPGTGYTAAHGVFEKSGARRDTEYYDDEWTRRTSSARTFNNTMTFESEDKVQMLIDPESAYVRAMGNGMKRAYDRLIIEAATASITQDGSSTAFPSTQRISTGQEQISFALITQVQEKFLGNEQTIDVPKIALISPVQIRQLMAETKQTSADYVNREALQNLTQYGIVNQWMGFTWIMTNYLTAPATGMLDLLFFTNEALGLVVNKDIEVIIGRNPSKSYMWQVFYQFSAHAARIQDEHIVVLRVRNNDYDTTAAPTTAAPTTT